MQQLTACNPFSNMHAAAGVRVDAEQLSRSRMSYYTGLSIVPSDVLVPAPAEAMMDVTGYPEGAWLNYVTWSPDGSYIAFTTRSPGMLCYVWGSAWCYCGRCHCASMGLSLICHSLACCSSN
jgi:hypothetical protein